MARFNEYETFIAIAEQGTLAAAAKTLHLSPSAVSKQLSALEARLGTVLVRRSTRGLTLTASGKKFYASLEAPLSALNRVESNLKSDTEAACGKIHLTLSNVLINRPIMSALNRFSDEYPDILLHLSVTDDAMNLVESPADVALRIGTLSDSTLRARTLFTTQGHFYSSPDYLQRAGTPESPIDLKDHRVILPTYINLSEKMRLLTRSAKTPDLKEFHSADNATAILARIRTGGGIAFLLDCLAAEYVDNGELITILPALATPPQPVSLVWASQSEQQTAIRVLIDFLSAQNLSALS